MYASQLEQLGIELAGEIHSTRLKNRIVDRITIIHAYQEGRENLLAYDSDIGTALKRSERDESDKEAYWFVGEEDVIYWTFKKNCQNDSIPQCLFTR